MAKVIQLLYVVFITGIICLQQTASDTLFAEALPSVAPSFERSSPSSPSSQSSQSSSSRLNQNSDSDPATIVPVTPVVPVPVSDPLETRLRNFLNLDHKLTGLYKHWSSQDPRFAALAGMPCLF